MGTIRLGKRTEGRSPLIRDFVPLTNLSDIEFGGWDIFEDSVYDAALNARVLERNLIEAVKDRIRTSDP
jgi:myo-inositol-1-phosphate synthase